MILPSSGRYSRCVGRRNCLLRRLLLERLIWPPRPLLLALTVCSVALLFRSLKLLVCIVKLLFVLRRRHKASSRHR